METKKSLQKFTETAKISKILSLKQITNKDIADYLINQDWQLFRKQKVKELQQAFIISSN